MRRVDVYGHRAGPEQRDRRRARLEVSRSRKCRCPQEVRITPGSEIDSRHQVDTRDSGGEVTAWGAQHPSDGTALDDTAALDNDDLVGDREGIE